MENVRKLSDCNECFNDVGSLALFKNITNDDINLFIDLITNDFSPFVKVLYNIVGDRSVVLKIIDAFEGQRIYFPDRKKSFKTMERVVIYNYIVNHNYSDESYSTMSKQFSKRVSQIRNIVNRIDSLKSKGTYSFVEDGDLDE